jgi:hypothetical protein
MNDIIEIPISKNKIFLGIGGSIIFIILGIWTYINANEFHDSVIIIFRNPLINRGFGILGILFFGATGIYGIKKVFDKKVGLRIDSNGITDNSNASSIGLIEWNDITEIRTKQVMSTKFLLIYIVNPEKYIEKAKNGMKAKLLRTNMKMYGTPLSLTSNTLKYDFVELKELIQIEFENNKNTR